MVTIGQTYSTSGGWQATVIWVAEFSHFCYAIHKPKSKEESVPIAHNKYDGKSVSLLSVNDPPRYDKSHPADLIIPL